MQSVGQLPDAWRAVASRFSGSPLRVGFAEHSLLSRTASHKIPRKPTSDASASRLQPSAFSQHTIYRTYIRLLSGALRKTASSRIISGIDETYPQYALPILLVIYLGPVWHVEMTTASGTPLLAELRLRLRLRMCTDAILSDES